MERFEQLIRDEMSPRQLEVADAISAGPRGGLRGPFIALIHNAELASHVQALGEHLRFKTGLPRSAVEIPILITAHRWASDYEWLAHARIAREAELHEDVIEALGRGVKPENLDPDSELLYSFSHETVWNGRPHDATFNALKNRFGNATVLDVLALCGYYTLLAFVLNTAQLPLPPGKLPEQWGTESRCSGNDSL